VHAARQAATSAVVRCAPWPLIKIKSAIISKAQIDFEILCYEEQASQPLLNPPLQVADAQMTSIGDLSLIFADRQLETVARVAVLKRTSSLGFAWNSQDSHRGKCHEHA
jgi:hypothetical protein